MTIIRDKPLRVKISIGIFLCIVLLTTIGTILNSVIIKNQFVSSIDRDTSNTFLYYLEKINNTTNTMIDNGRSISLAGETLYQIHNSGYPFNMEAVYERFLTEKVRQIPIILGSGLWYEPYAFGGDRKYFGPYAYWEGGDVKLTWEYNTRAYDYHGREWYTIAMDEKKGGAEGKKKLFYITRPYMDFLNRKQIIFMSMTIPMRDLRGKIIGVSTTDWSLDVIHRYLGFLRKFSYTPGSFVMLVDRVDGRIIYHADRKLVMKPFAGHSLAKAIDYKTLSERHMSMAKKISFEGREYHVYYQRSSAGFLFIMAVPPAELYARAVRTLVAYILLSFAVVGVVIFMVSRFIDANMIRRILAINRRITDIKQGSYEGRVSFEERDEITQIADNIDDMSRTILLREEQLRGLQRYLADVIESMPLMLISVNSDGSITHYNRTFASFAGVGATEAIGRNLCELVPQFSKYRPDFLRAIESKTPRLIQRETIEREQKLYLNISIFPLLGTAVSDGVFLVENITDAENKNRQLRQTEIRYQTLFNSARDAIFLMIDDRFADCNLAALNLFGCTRDEVIGETLMRFSPPLQPDGRDSAARAMENIHSAYSGIPQFFEWRHRRLDGTEFDCDVSLNMVEPEEQHILFVIVRDITDRKKREYAILTSEKRYRSLYRDNPSMFFTLDERHTVVSVNEFGAAKLGYAIAELEGEAVGKVIYGPDRDAVAEQLQKCLRNPWQVFSWQFRKVRKDGSLMWVEEYARAVAGPEGALNIFIVCQDIDKRKKAEELLRIQHDLGIRLNSITELAEAMDLIVSSVIGIESMDSGALYLVDADTGDLELACSSGLSRAFSDGMGRCGSDMSGGASIADGMPAYFDYDDTAGAAGGSCVDDMARVEGLRSLALIPVRYGGVTIACLLIGSHTTRDIPASYRSALESIASMIGDTIIRLRAEEQVKASLREKEILLKEIHHRVKNNLQIIVSLLSLQANNVTEEESIRLFSEAEDRIRAMAAIHEELYRSGDYANIDFESYISEVVRELIDAYPKSTADVSFEMNIKNSSIGLNQAVPLGLIINEVITNSLKHAFPAGFGDKAVIGITLRHDGDNSVELSVWDNGIGIPGDIDLERTSSFGMTLIRILAEQLKGRIRLDREGGTRYTLAFRRE